MTEQKNVATQTRRNRKKNVDPRLTVRYYSMFQRWTDFVGVFFACVFSMIVAILVITLVYLLVISPHPTINIFYMMSKIFEFVTLAFIRFIKLIYSLLS